MLSLFALGVPSIVWVAFVAALIAFEKLIPMRFPPSLFREPVRCRT
jgi:predicted metal-binding membrane protein